MSIVRAQNEHCSMVVPNLVLSYFCDFKNCMDPALRFEPYKERALEALNAGRRDTAYVYYVQSCELFLERISSASVY